jgi:hypothetical protein
MAENPCLDLVRQSIPDMSAKELSEVIDMMKAEQASWIAKGLTSEDAAKKAGEEVAGRIRAAIKIERRNAAINRRIRLEAVDYLNANWGDDLVEGVLALLYGSPKSRRGSRGRSAGAAQSANFRRYIGGMQRELEQAGLFDVVRRREMDAEISQALWFIGDEDTLARLPSSAVKVAKILEKWREVARIEANRHGAWIPKAKNYIVRQTNDPNKILSGGLAKWKEAALARFDLDRMFPDGVPEDLDTWLTEAYNNITTGVRPRSPADASAERMGAFKGPRNLAKRLSADRVFYFKSADDWFKYNEEFGHGSLIEAYVNDIHRRAEATGLMQVFGTNPEYNLDAIVKAIRTQLSRTDPKALRAFDSRSRAGEKFENALRELTGYTRTVASAQLANVGAGIRVVNVMGGLGAATLQAIGDVPIRASLLRYQGASFLGQLAKGLFDPLKRILVGAGSAERRAIVSALGHFNDVALRNMVSRWSPDETIPGKMHAATNTFFKYNLLGPWTEEQRRGALEAMGAFLGQQSKKGWTELSDQTRRSLIRFDITEREWELGRRGIDIDDQNMEFITPDKIRELPLTEFTEMAAARIEAVQRGLLERVQKRMKADLREQAWIDKRHAHFTAKLEKANEKLLALAERRQKRALSRRELLTGRIEKVLTDTEKRAEAAQQQAFDRMVEKVVVLNKQLGELAIELENLRDWWKNSFDFERAPGYGKRAIREAGNLEGTLRAKHAQARREFLRVKAEFKRKMDEATISVEELRSDLTARAEDELEGVEAATREDIQEHYDTFNEAWKERYAELKEYIGELETRMTARREDTSGDLDKLGGQVERVLDDTRNGLADRFQRYYADEVDSAVITPDARALAFTRRGTQAGTSMGEALRLFWQFKTFPIGVIQRGFMREFYGYDLGRGGRFGMSEARGLALLLVATTAFGYMSMTLKELLRGRKPRPPDDPRTWRDAMMQGGSLGMYGDYLLGTQARFGKGFIASLGGPTVGKIEDLSSLYAAVVSGQDPRAKALRLAVQQIPYNNLFYTKTAIDYLFMYELQEAMNPGYLRRFERKITEETGSEWWLRPTEVAQ